jgi:hypothetical protein
VKNRFKISFRVMFRVTVRFRFRIKIRVKIRVRVRVRVRITSLVPDSIPAGVIEINHWKPPLFTVHLYKVKWDIFPSYSPFLPNDPALFLKFSKLYIPLVSDTPIRVRVRVRV